MDLRDRYRGVLLGTAIGDALGLPMEGMSARAIAKHYGELDRYRLLGRVGFVSDDTEQSALVAQSLARHPRDRERFVRAFRRALLGWFVRLPWGIGFATLRACLRIGVGLARSGVHSAGNGAAMRASIVGAFFFDDDAQRRAWVDALSVVTHTDPRAVQGARFVAEVTAQSMTSDEPIEVARRAAEVVADADLRRGIERAIQLALGESTALDAALEIGTTGFVMHTVPLATFFFVRFSREPDRAIAETIRAGGDTDSNAAIVGAWVGALHGASAFPRRLVDDLQSGPFGRAHLERLADALVSARSEPTKATYAWPIALARNVAMFPVVLAHAVRVLVLR